MSRVKDCLPDFATIFAVASSEAGQVRNVSLEPDEWNILALVDGHRDINDIVAATHREPLETLKRLASLQLAGLIRVSDKAAPPRDHLEAMVDRLGQLIEDYLTHRINASMTSTAGKTGP
jgi:hypothetical protein